jgi:hypothetical protein
LLHRLADCPPEFLLPPEETNLIALVCDHYRALRVSIPTPKQRGVLANLPAPTQRVIPIILWLLRDEWFASLQELADATRELLLSDALAKLARLVRPEAFVNDPDRREELVRFCLKALGVRLDGETAAQAADRLTTLDSVERDHVIRATRTAEARAREIREAMARKRAEEAAARYSPE